MSSRRRAAPQQPHRADRADPRRRAHPGAARHALPAPRRARRPGGRPGRRPRPLALQLDRAEPAARRRPDSSLPARLAARAALPARDRDTGTARRSAARPSSRRPRSTRCRTNSPPRRQRPSPGGPAPPRSGSRASGRVQTRSRAAQPCCPLERPLARRSPPTWRRARRRPVSCRRGGACAGPTDGRSSPAAAGVGPAAADGVQAGRVPFRVRLDALVPFMRHRQRAIALWIFAPIAVVVAVVATFPC